MLKTKREEEKAVWLPESLITKITLLAKVKHNMAIKDYVKVILEEHVEKYTEVFELINEIEE